MILTGTAILRESRRGRIVIDPFDAEKITTNSYDLALGSHFLRYTEPVIDPRRPNAYDSFNVGAEGILMPAGDFVIGHSAEVVGSDHYVPIVHAKSGIARLGLFVHITADLIDLGSLGQIGFQLHSTLPIRLYPGMTVAQVTFWKPKGEIVLYKGRYQNSKGARASEVFKDYPED